MPKGWGSPPTTGFGREEGTQPDTRHARAGSRRYRHRTTDPAPRERARFGGREPDGAHRGSDPARLRPRRRANRRTDEDADSAASVATTAPNPYRSAGLPPPLPTGPQGPEPGCSRSSRERSASGSEESPSSLRHLDLQRNALQRRERRAPSASARDARQPRGTAASAASLDETFRLQPASADCWGLSRTRRLRADGPADENGKSGTAAALPKGSSHRASALRPDATTGTRTARPPRRKGRPGKARRQHGVRVAPRERPPGRNQRAGRCRSLRARADAPERSSDREGTAQRIEDGQDHHTHATRKDHWTWRFTWVPWDRHSSGRKRRSGRRFLGGSPRRDHVKVVGRGTPTWCSCWLAGMKGFGPHRDTVPTAIATSGASAPGASTLRQRGTCEDNDTEWHEQTLNWQSPWEHRAADRLKRRTDATDFTADEGPEVGQTRTTTRPGALACESTRPGGRNGE
jgi:hypothetical protein